MKRSVRNGLAIATMSGGLFFLGTSVAGANDDPVPPPVGSAPIEIVEEQVPPIEEQQTPPLREEQQTLPPAEEEEQTPPPAEDEQHTPPVQEQQQIPPVVEELPAADALDTRSQKAPEGQHGRPGCDGPNPAPSAAGAEGRGCHDDGWKDCDDEEGPYRSQGGGRDDCRDHDDCDWDRDGYEGGHDEHRKGYHGDEDRDCHHHDHDRCDKYGHHGDRDGHHGYKDGKRDGKHHGDRDRDCHEHDYDHCDGKGHHGDKHHDKDCEEPTPAPAAPVAAAPAAPAAPVVHVAPVKVVETTTASPKALAYTGAEVSGPLTLGLLALGAGGALTLAGRRRKSAEA